MRTGKDRHCSQILARRTGTTWRSEPFRYKSFKAKYVFASSDRAGFAGRVALGDYSPRAPTDPDVRIPRIWLFISLRYATEQTVDHPCSGKTVPHR